MTAVMVITSDLQEFATHLNDQLRKLQQQYEREKNAINMSSQPPPQQQPPPIPNSMPPGMNVPPPNLPQPCPGKNHCYDLVVVAHSIAWAVGRSCQHFIRGSDPLYLRPMAVAIRTCVEMKTDIESIAVHQSRAICSIGTRPIKINPSPHELLWRPAQCIRPVSVRSMCFEVWCVVSAMID